MRKYIRIEDEEHCKKVQEKLFEMGYEWNGVGKVIESTDAKFLTFVPKTGKIYWATGSWIPDQDYIEVVLLETVSYEFKEVEQVVELNGKKYRKCDLEEALKHLKPLEN